MPQWRTVCLLVVAVLSCDGLSSSHVGAARALPGGAPRVTASASVVSQSADERQEAGPSAEARIRATRGSGSATTGISTAQRQGSTRVSRRPRRGSATRRSATRWPAAGRPAPHGRSASASPEGDRRPSSPARPRAPWSASSAATTRRSGAPASPPGRRCIAARSIPASMSSSASPVTRSRRCSLSAQASRRARSAWPSRASTRWCGSRTAHSSSGQRRDASV